MADSKLNVTNELLKLAELKEKGVLSDEEFTSAKAALLRSLHAATPDEMKECEDCKGSGTCPRCDGSGTTQKTVGWFDTLKTVTCTRCDGNRRCPTCRGKGSVVVKR